MAFNPHFFIATSSIKNIKLRNASFPAVFVRENGKVRKIIKSSELNECKNLDELMGLVKEKAKNIN